MSEIACFRVSGGRNSRVPDRVRPEVADTIYPDDGRCRQGPPSQHKGDWGRHERGRLDSKRIRIPRRRTNY